ncbi:MAG: alpha/beta hydrolase [Halieaceae bacterium]
MGSPEQVLQELLQKATIHRTSYEHGELSWQEWPCDRPDDKPPLVLLHGGFGSWTHWVANIPALIEQRKVWTLDLPGLGDSSDMPEPHTPKHAADIILHSLDGLLGPTTHFEVAGFSFGAMVGARLALAAGSRCERFVAIGAAGCGELHVQVHLVPPPGPDIDPEEAASIHHGNLRVLMFADEDLIDELAIHTHGQNLARHRINTRRISLSDDFLQALPLIEAKLVGVWGSRDATAGHNDAIEKRRQLFEQAQPGAEFHVLDGIGHWAMYEAPAAINRILLD